MRAILEEHEFIHLVEANLLRPDMTGDEISKLIKNTNKKLWLKTFSTWNSETFRNNNIIEEKKKFSWDILVQQFLDLYQKLK